MSRHTPKEPTLDESGRIQVSNKMDYAEYSRTVANRERLHISAIEYNEMAHKKLNDYHENVSPAIELKSKSKIKEITEDMEKITKDFSEHKTYTASIEELLSKKEEELKILKKV